MYLAYNKGEYASSGKTMYAMIMLNKTVCTKKKFFISQLKHVVGTQKNRLNETVHLSTQNIC